MQRMRGDEWIEGPPSQVDREKTAAPNENHDRGRPPLIPVHGRPEDEPRDPADNHPRTGRAGMQLPRRPPR